MTTPTTILRDSALMLPALIVVGAALGGFPVALAVLVTGVVTLVNLAVIGWMASEPTRFLALAVPKLLLVIAAFAALVTVFDPLAVGLSLAAVLTTVAVAGAVGATRADHQGAALRET